MSCENSLSQQKAYSKACKRHKGRHRQVANSTKEAKEHGHCTTSALYQAMTAKVEKQGATGSEGYT